MTISLGQLPMKDLEAYLSLVCGFSQKSERAVDTKYVNGIDSSLVAIAATDEEGKLINDRETVQNALSLNGKSADKYLLKEDSTSLLGDTYTVSTTISDEIKSIRDELYQTKAELAKLGLIKQGPIYDGFYDAFKNDDIKYNNDVITTLAQSSNETGAITTITVEDDSNLTVGEYIVIKTNKETQVTKITSINSNRIDVSPSIIGPLSTDTKIYKTAGIYNKGMFVFGEKTDSYASSDVYKIILKDGKKRQIIKTLNSSFSGFATKCANIYSLEGALSKIQVSLACDGNPGIIRIALYEIVNEDNNYTYKLLSESNSISSSEVTGILNNYNFTFDNFIEISRDKEYVVLLKTEYANESNRWYIGGFTDDCADDCVCCSGDTYDYISDTFQLCDTNDDMYIAFYMSEIVDNEINYMQRGLYTCNLEVPNKFSRVRVELKVNREGIFNSADNNNLIYNEENPLQLSGNEYSHASLFNAGQLFVGGTSIGRVGSTVNSNNRFTVKDNMYIPYDSEVYRVGYKVLALVKNKTIDYNNTSNPETYSETKVIELPLVSVMKGKEPGREQISSDRLIFEYEVGLDEDNAVNVLNTYNVLEVQVYWDNNSVQSSILNSDTDLAGKILDIVVSTDKSYNKKM